MIINGKKYCSANYMMNSVDLLPCGGFRSFIQDQFSEIQSGHKSLSNITTLKERPFFQA